MSDKPEQPQNSVEGKTDDQERPQNQPAEVGGRKGPEPTRYGDWEKNGRCIDF
jgi:hypothetical protein